MDITWQPHKLEGNDLRFLNYAVTRLGQRIGRGECWDLADQALESLPSVMYHRGLGPGGDYKWGLLSATITRANPVANLRPGMILQFRDAVFHWRRNRKVYLRKAEHHTAIVSAVSDDKNDLCILHQNESGVRQVTFGYYRISSIKGGTVWAYAPHWLSSNEQPQQD